MTATVQQPREASAGAPAPDRTPRGRARGLLGAVAVVAVLGGALALIARPWHGSTAAVAAMQFTGLADGQTVLEQESGTSGTWVSVSNELAPAEDITSIDQPWVAALYRLVGTAHGPSASQAALARLTLQVRSRVIAHSTGTPSVVTDAYAWGPNGQLWLGERSANDAAVVFDPPVPVLSADPTAVHHWSGKGKQTFPDGSVVPYRSSGRLVHDRSVNTAYGRRTGCTEVTNRLRWTRDGATSGRDVGATYCPGLGLVSETDAPAGDTPDTYRVISTAGHPATARPDLPAPPARASVGPGAVGGWQLTRVGRTDPTTAFAGASTAPAYVPSDPPVLVAADDARPGVVALDPSLPGTVRWRFATPGHVLGAITADPRRARVYFGASDEHVYALDGRGVFLWSVATGDNVAAAPVVAGRLVVIAGEDGHVRAVDADTGRERWNVDVGEPVASTPVVLRGQVVVGGDDGVVRSLRLRDGKAGWRLDVGAPVETGLAADGGRVIVPTNPGGLTAVDARSGNEIWSTAVVDQLDQQPIVWRGLVVAVTGSGGLIAYDARTGARRWRVRHGRHQLSGPPAVLGGLLVAARDDDAMLAFDHSGRIRHQWTAPADVALQRAEVPGDDGLVTGGGALWRNGRGAMVLRLGPPPVPTDVDAPWAHLPSSSPIDWVPSALAGPWHGRVVGVDASGRLATISTRDGTVRQLGRVDLGATYLPSAPVVAGNLLLVDTPDRLVAVHLPDGREAWHLAHGSPAAQSPVVSGDTVALAWGEDGAATIAAVDLLTGAVRWKASGGTGYGVQSPVITAGGLVIGGSPLTAWDLTTGTPRWTSSVQFGFGLAASPDGSSVFAMQSGATGQPGTVSSVDAASGAVRWTSDVPSVGLAFGDHLLATDDSVVASDAGHLVALDPATGDAAWHLDLPEAMAELAATDGDRIVVALEHSAVVELDSATGTVTAAQPGVAEDVAFSPDRRPVVAGGTIVVAVDTAMWGVRTGATP